MQFRGSDKAPSRGKGGFARKRAAGALLGFQVSPPTLHTDYFFGARLFSVPSYEYYITDAQRLFLCDAIYA